MSRCQKRRAAKKERHFANVDARRRQKMSGGLIRGVDGVWERTKWLAPSERHPYIRVLRTEMIEVCDGVILPARDAIDERRTVRARLRRYFDEINGDSK